MESVWKVLIRVKGAAMSDHSYMPEIIREVILTILVSALEHLVTLIGPVVSRGKPKLDPGIV